MRRSPHVFWTQFQLDFVIDNLDNYLPYLSRIVNMSLENGSFPQCFKTAYVKPIIKKPSLDPEVLKNYRPVSNLSYFSKILERVVAGQLQRHMDDNNLNNPFQSAYRKGHSCETAVLRVHNDILRALDQGYVVVHVMLDLSAAFDTLDHNILLNRLKAKIGITDTVFDWFKSYLSNRSQHVFVKGSVSSKSPLNIGVPQGSVLGPILFNVYTLPLYELARDNGTISGFYADDSQLYLICDINSIPCTFSALETVVHDFMHWMSANRLKLNGDKTELTVFNKPRVGPRVRSILPQFNVDTAPIPPQTSCRILGSFFDSEMTMENHINQFCKSANFHIRNIYSIKKYLDQKTIETLVHAFITSRMDFCNSILVGITKRNLARLQRIQNRAARLCLGIPKFARVSNISLLKTLHWLPVSFRIDFKILLLTFKCIHGLAPSYLSELVNVRCLDRTLRSSGGLVLDVPKSRTKTFGDRAFSVAAPRLWNELPVHLRSTWTLEKFKQDLKTHFCDTAFN